jgi:hypothetical protein
MILLTELPVKRPGNNTLYQIVGYALHGIAENVVRFHSMMGSAQIAPGCLLYLEGYRPEREKNEDEVMEDYSYQVCVHFVCIKMN